MLIATMETQRKAFDLTNKLHYIHTAVCNHTVKNKKHNDSFHLYRMFISYMGTYVCIYVLQVMHTCERV